MQVKRASERAKAPCVIESYRIDGVAIVRIDGELDVYSAPRVREALVALANPGVGEVALDLTATTFIDSSGLGAILGGFKRIRGIGGYLWLGGTSEATKRLLEVTGLDRVLEQRPASALPGISGASDELVLPAEWSLDH